MVDAVILVISAFVVFCSICSFAPTVIVAVSTSIPMRSLFVVCAVAARPICCASSMAHSRLPLLRLTDRCLSVCLSVGLRRPATRLTALHCTALHCTALHSTPLTAPPHSPCHPPAPILPDTCASTMSMLGGLGGSATFGLKLPARCIAAVLGQQHAAAAESDAHHADAGHGEHGLDGAMSPSAQAVAAAAAAAAAASPGASHAPTHRFLVGTLSAKEDNEIHCIGTQRTERNRTSQENGWR